MGRRRPRRAGWPGGQVRFEYAGAAAPQGDGGRSAGEPRRMPEGSCVDRLQRCRTLRLAHHGTRHLPLLAQRHTRRGRPHQMGKHVLLPSLDIMQKLPYRLSGAASELVHRRSWAPLVRPKRPGPTPSRSPYRRTAVSAADTSKMKQRPLDAGAGVGGVRSPRSVRSSVAPARLVHRRPAR